MRSAILFFAAVVAVCALTLLFQTFIRYRYEQVGGVLWRVDELGGARCVVGAPYTPCLAPKSTSLSTSTSASLSVSPSVSVNARSHPHPRKAAPQ